MRILIADDNVQLCKILEEFLNNQEGWEVVGTVHDGEQALVQLQNTPVDLILLDISMPYLDGLAVLERLRTLKLEKKPKVIIITAFGRDSLIPRLSALGADYFLLKPFRLDILKERIKEFGRETSLVRGEEPAFIAPTPLSKERRITKLLHRMGVPPHFKGFSYLREATLMFLEGGEAGAGLTKEIYPALAKKHKTTSGGVEAAIRNAVMAAWQNGNKQYIKELCEPYCNGRNPTTALIIARIAAESHVASDYDWESAASFD